MANINHRAHSPASTASSRLSLRNKHKPKARGDKLTLALKQEIKQLRKSQKEMREKNKRLTQELAKATHKDTLKLRKAENDIADLMQIQNQQKQRHQRDMKKVKERYKKRIKALQGRLRIMLGEKDEVDLANEGAITDLLETLTEELKDRTDELEKSQERYTELTKQNEELYSEKVKLEATLTSAYEAALRRNQELQDQLDKLENKRDSQREASRVRELHLQVEKLKKQLKDLRKQAEQRPAFSSNMARWSEPQGYQRNQSLSSVTGMSSPTVSTTDSRRSMLEAGAHKRDR